MLVVWSFVGVVLVSLGRGVVVRSGGGGGRGLHVSGAAGGHYVT
jgi:hypothetical protein